jgi:hypothetical protein
MTMPAMIPIFLLFIPLPVPPSAADLFIFYASSMARQ